MLSRAILGSKTFSILRTKFGAKALGLVVEQGLTTAWNFLIGMFIARFGGVEMFGAYSTVMAVYFMLAGPTAALTTGITSVDAARLNVARASYSLSAALMGERIVLVLLLPAAFAIALEVRHFDESSRLIGAILGIGYVSLTFLADFWRRSLALSNHVSKLNKASFSRLATLIIVIFFTVLYFGFNFIAEFVVFSVPLITAIYVFFIRAQFLRNVKAIGRRSTRNIAIGRQIKFGLWGFFSAVVMYGLDQGAIIYIGIIGKSEIAAELRSASYLFGLMTPILIVLDLMLPGFVAENLGRKPTLGNVLSFIGAGAIVSAVSVTLVVMLTRFVWLPFLGSQYHDVDHLTYWFGASFFCMMVRTFAMPFLKTQSPKLLFLGALAGTCSGLLAFCIQDNFDAESVVRGLFVSAVVLSTTSIFTLFWLYFGKPSART